MSRYQVVPDSVSAHCCFRATVIDSQTPSPRYPGRYETICECFSGADASKVAEALNAADDAMCQSGAVDKALEYLRPHLEAGTFAAPAWAIQLASILTGGDGCGTPGVAVSDSDLPGMWESADFMGGKTDCESHSTPSGLAALRGIAAEMRSRKVNHGKGRSPTLIAWADRIDATLAAVNELIEVATQIKARLDARRAKAFAERGGWQWHSREDEGDYERLCAALARVGGAA